jgi:anaerobic magnesium-protoporphyrin IX monomethyl ester cyclase
MKVALVGPELEENLGLRYLHAAVAAAGHEPRIIEFHGPEQIESTANGIISWNPDVVGLSMVFTARAREFVDLAGLLRGKRFEGRIVAGGQFASFHGRELLSNFPAFDFIVHGEGETTLVDLLANIDAPRNVAGISYREAGRAAVATAARPNPDDLDTLPWPTRTPPFYCYMGIPIANILGSRGCFGKCSFCSISAWYRQNSGRRFGQRSVNSIAMEMAHLYHAYGVRIFNFHDDTFFLSNEARDLERFSSLEGALHAKGLDDIAIQVKARTDAITPAVLDVLERIGLFRVFLGVENFSSQGLRSLGKGTTVDINRRALCLLRDRELHVTYNLLMFGPDTTVQQLMENVDCIRKFDDLPVNFGRVEVYGGTPLEHDLRARGMLKGDWFGYHYEIADKTVQNMFEVFRTVFTERNFQVTGTNFQAMKLDYYHRILKHFFPRLADDGLAAQKSDIIRRLNRSNADLLSRICEENDAGEAANQRLAKHLLGLRRDDDRILSREFCALIRTIERLAKHRRRSLSPGKVAVISAAAATLLVSAQRCNFTAVQPAAPTGTDQPDTLTVPTELPNLDSGETAKVRQRIDGAYKSSIDSLGAALGYVNRPMQFNLCLDSSGNVDSCEIIVPARDSAPAFAEAVQATMRQWNFPDIGRRGKCGITMTVAFTDTSWHMCEIIGYPLDTATPVPPDTARPLTEYSGADSQLVTDKFYSDYMGAVDSLCNAYDCVGKEFSIMMVVDSTGTVVNCSVAAASGADTLPAGFAPALGALGLGWRFPGVSRKGYCVITTGIIVVVPPTIYEIMAFPRESPK